MSTAAQTLANRENAQLSTGPRTAEGKSRSAVNATRHGLAGSFAILPHESVDEFEDLETELLHKFQPGDAHEHFLVNQMIQAAWRLARIERLEGRAFELSLETGDQSTDPDARIVKAVNGGSSFLDNFQRYRTAAERSYFKAHKALLDSRAAAKQSRTAEARLETAEKKREVAEMKRETAAAIKAIDDFVYAPLPFLRNEPKSPNPVNPRESVAKK